MSKRFLEDLANKIVDAGVVSPEQLTEDLLAMFKVTGSFANFEQAIMRFFLEQADNPSDALDYVLDGRRRLAGLLTQLVGDSVEAIQPTENKTTIIRRILEEADIPVLRMPLAYTGIEQIQRDLAKEESRLNELDEKGFLHVATMGWGYLDTLLTICIEYYARILAADNSSALHQSFSHARRVSTLNKRLEAIKGIQNAYEKAQKIGHYESDQCRWHLGRDFAFADFMKGGESFMPKDYPIEWCEFIHKNDTRLQADGDGNTITAKQFREQERNEKVIVNKTAFYCAHVSYFRNFYAHSNPNQWRAADIEIVSASLRTARALLDELYPLCPELILVVEKGIDMYGRQIVRFVKEDALGEVLYPLDLNNYCLKFDVARSEQRMFVAENSDIKLHEFYLCSRPAADRRFQPPYVVASDVIGNLDHRKPEDWIHEE